MSAIYRTATVISIAAAMIVMLGGNTLAETVYEYDYSSCATGALNSTDTWTRVSTTGQFLTVYNDTASTGGYDWDNYCGIASTYGDSRSDRINNESTPGGWGFSLQNDQNFDYSSVFMVKGSSYKAAVYLQEEATTTGKGFAVNVNGNALRWYWFGNSFTLANFSASATHGLAADTAVRVGMNVAYNSYDNVAGTYSYTVTPYYMNLSTLVTTTLTPSTVSVATTETFLPENMKMLRIYEQNKGSRIDGIRFATVPEPSTLALLACGMIGLLAYAWRKRK